MVLFVGANLLKIFWRVWKSGKKIDFSTPYKAVFACFGLLFCVFLLQPAPFTLALRLARPRMEIISITNENNGNLTFASSLAGSEREVKGEWRGSESDDSSVTFTCSESIVPFTSADESRLTPLSLLITPSMRNLKIYFFPCSEQVSVFLQLVDKLSQVFCFHHYAVVFGAYCYLP